MAYSVCINPNSFWVGQVITGIHVSGKLPESVD